MENNRDTVDVAKFVISYYNDIGEPITQLKLHKVLYYIQAWSLVHFDGNPTFSEEPEAWLNGPVYPSVYRAFPSKKSVPIKVSLFEDGFFNSHQSIFEKYKTKMNFRDKEENLLASVFSKYGAMQDLLLVYTTHEEDPWIEARKGLPPFARSNNKISLESMRSYYGKRLEAARKS